jgi:hypothetical protein
MVTAIVVATTCSISRSVNACLTMAVTPSVA